MCGICGIVAFDGSLAPGSTEVAGAMCTAIAHRGPDEQGLWTHPSAVLGHRRLSIIDRAGGQQPLSNEDGTCWIVFNGEVYNHHGLRERLESRGHQFRTRSDTEAIVHAWEEFGPACVDYLEGMFAFAIFDARTRELFAARDRLGKKPFFYAVAGDTLYFASELKAIVRAAPVDVSVDRDTLQGYLMLGYSVAPATAFRHIKQLEPGYSLHLKGGRITTRRYWDVTVFDTDTRAAGALVEEIDARVRGAVLERLESEVPLGVFLSGGLDSGLVTSYMAEALDRRVIATSVGFASQAHDELAAASLTARHLDAEQHIETVQPSLDEALDQVIAAFDEPFADPSAIPTWHVSMMARRHVTVALSGDGGDEAFGGYTFRYQPLLRESALRRWLGAGDGPSQAAGAVNAWWPRTGRLPVTQRVGGLLDNLAASPAEAYFLDLCFLKPRGAAALLGAPEQPVHRDTDVYARVVDTYARCPSPSLVQRAQYADLKIYLSGDVLTKVDRTSMQHGLEVRAPLLDRRLIEFAFTLPTAAKMPGGEGKFLLRQLAARRLPAELLTMPKKGFSPPLGDWLAGAGGDRFADEALAPSAALRDLLDTDALKAVFARRQAQASGDVHALWSCWVLERWLQSLGSRSAPARQQPLATPLA